jgi:hypothetical protein
MRCEFSIAQVIYYSSLMAKGCQQFSHQWSAGPLAPGRFPNASMRGPRGHVRVALARERRKQKGPEDP